ncbi:MAG: Uridylate kinase [Candidatus Peregrinibacteria bacterium GW2011_GWA2_47_7]|nr:MAG: Uridylate kinase [Candidatus Peregrinibacteria bacterium GW2011_GWA2_47_7]
MLKLSGEVLEGKNPSGIDFKVLHDLCAEIIDFKKLGCEVAIVIGGGNIWRYRDFKETGINRVTSDHIGIMATIMNALAMQSMFEKLGVECRVASALEVPQIAEPYRRRKAIRHLEKGRIVICAGGTGSPFFTTDSAAALRALELDCAVLLKATKVDGVYDRDPEKFKNAQFFKEISYHDVLEKDLAFMDQSAVSLCKEGNLPIIVFNLQKRGNIKKVIMGASIGTRIH